MESDLKSYNMRILLNITNNKFQIYEIYGNFFYILRSSVYSNDICDSFTAATTIMNYLPMHTVGSCC